MEKINVDEVNGLIEQVQMTSTGFTDRFNPYVKLEAAYAYNVSGGAYFTEKEDKYPLINVKNGCSVSYRYLDFSEKDSWTIQLVGKLLEACKVKVYINNEELCEIECQAKDTQASGAFRSNEEKADLRLEFIGASDNDIIELNEVRFS